MSQLEPTQELQDEQDVRDVCSKRSRDDTNDNNESTPPPAKRFKSKHSPGSMLPPTTKEKTTGEKTLVRSGTIVLDEQQVSGNFLPI